MKIEIESSDDARSCAAALFAWLQKGLESSGHLHARDGEDRYYADRREVMRILQLFQAKE